jgi:uncharacterized protein YajQ (UPF0234 family)
MCKGNNCKKQALYNYKGEIDALYCGNCKLDGMINIKHPKCIICNNKIPSFGMINDKKAQYCADCKLDGMNDIKHSKCISCNIKRPNFGMINDKKAQYCSDCKLNGMIDIKNSKCIICNIKRPSFGMQNDKKAQYCNDCKLDGMIDIKHPKCIICNNKIPIFGMIEDKKAQYCANCKLNDMCDITNTKCIICNIKRPYFEMPEAKNPQYCSSCKLDGMINIITHKCIICKNKQPSFGMPDDKKANYCANCKLDGMVDIINPKCKSLWCSTIFSNKQYNGYCRYCFMHLFPDIPISRNYKTKEKTVVDYIKEHLSHIDIIADKRIEGGCSKRRPDILIDVGFQIIIVEIDENQHTNYDCSCENKRLMELSHDVGFRSIVFIRFNPDGYNINDKKITSCWYINKLGIYQINKKKINEWNDRLKNLKETIEYWCNQEHKINKTIEIIQLYYNQ